MIVETIRYNADTLKHYALHAFVVMPNHVHLLVTPATAKRANEMLGLTGNPFWREESYDRLVRDQREFDKIQHYTEENPVRAGLVNEPAEYR